MPEDYERQLWNELTKIANFLQHADRKPDNHLLLGKVDNTTILMHGCTAYQHLMRGHTVLRVSECGDLASSASGDGTIEIGGEGLFWKKDRSSISMNDTSQRSVGVPVPSTT